MRYILARSLWDALRSMDPVISLLLPHLDALQWRSWSSPPLPPSPLFSKHSFCDLLLASAVGIALAGVLRLAFIALLALTRLLFKTLQICRYALDCREFTNALRYENLPFFAVHGITLQRTVQYTCNINTTYIKCTCTIVVKFGVRVCTLYNVRVQSSTK